VAGQQWPYALCGWFGVEGGFSAVAARVKPELLGGLKSTDEHCSGERQ